MDLSPYGGSKFIKPEDLAKGPQRKTLEAIELGKFDRPVAVFSDQKRLSLNATNVNTLINIFGSTESDDLLGGEVELFVGEVKLKDGLAKSVLLRLPERAPEFDDKIPDFK
jgi:hypothetical protein